MIRQRNNQGRFINEASPIIRFWGKVNKTDNCWIWIGANDKHGYGSFKPAGIVVYAHRYSWELHNGKIPIGLDILHHCDNPSCVNPRHLFLGTHRDNMRDAAMKLRFIHKLTLAHISEIRSMKGIPQRKLAKKYGVCQQQISRIMRQERWSWYRGENHGN